VIFHTSFKYFRVLFLVMFIFKKKNVYALIFFFTVIKISSNYLRYALLFQFLPQISHQQWNQIFENFFILLSLFDNQDNVGLILRAFDAKGVADSDRCIADLTICWNVMTLNWFSKVIGIYLIKFYLQNNICINL